jgi:peroxiredoxin Q/BCP
MIDVGRKFPAFQLKNQDGRDVSLADYKGTWLAFYVYPKDDTPGCTIQAQAFTSTKREYEAAGVRAVGISADDVASHRAFCDKFSLDIDLLADTDNTLLRALGVGQSDYKGTKYWDRTTIVVDPDGVVRKVYMNVKPQGHEQTLLEDIKALQARG